MIGFFPIIVDWNAFYNLIRMSWWWIQAESVYKLQSMKNELEGEKNLPYNQPTIPNATVS